MATAAKRHLILWTVLASFACVAQALAQGTPAPAANVTAPAIPAAHPAPASPVQGIRNKLSAGDLLSAESILEVYKAKNGVNGDYLHGLSWLARGAFLLGDLEKAKRYDSEVLAMVADSLAHGMDLEKGYALEVALGAAVETQAQILQREKGATAAAGYVRSKLAELKGPISLVARLNKRIDMIAIVGTPAPEIPVEDYLGEKPPTLASLRGKPVMLFLFNQSCGDCKASAPALAAVKKKYAARGLQIYAVTRYYDGDSLRVKEKATADSVWKAVYSDLGPTPVAYSTAACERYGSSSTPTFVFVDAEGVVRGYTPTRLTEAEFDRAIGKIVR